MSESNWYRRRRGILRAEVIVISGLLVLLACLIVPLVARSRMESDRTTVRNRLRNLGQQFQIYHDQYRTLPSVPGPISEIQPIKQSDSP